MVANDSEVQYPFRMGLTWLNAHVNRTTGKRFPTLCARAANFPARTTRIQRQGSPGEEDGRKFFAMMREFTVTGFYTSEIGFKELDNPALKFYSESPECPHKDDREHRHFRRLARELLQDSNQQARHQKSWRRQSTT